MTVPRPPSKTHMPISEEIYKRVLIKINWFDPLRSSETLHLKLSAILVVPNKNSKNSCFPAKVMSRDLHEAHSTCNCAAKNNLTRL